MKNLIKSHLAVLNIFLNAYLALFCKIYLNNYVSDVTVTKTSSRNLRDVDKNIKIVLFVGNICMSVLVLFFREEEF